MRERLVEIQRLHYPSGDQKENAAGQLVSEMVGDSTFTMVK